MYRTPAERTLYAERVDQTDGDIAEAGEEPEPGPRALGLSQRPTEELATCRTSLFLPQAPLAPDLLPPLPKVASILRGGDSGDKAARRLLGLARDVIAGLQTAFER